MGLQVGFLIPILLLVTLVGHSNFTGLTVRGVWFFTEKYVLLAVGLLLVTALGGWIGMQFTVKRPLESPHATDRWDMAALVTGSIAIVAYLYFFRPLLLNPVHLLQTFTGAYRPDRTNLEISAGLTSLDNFTPIFFSIYAYKALSLRLPMKRWMKLMCVVLLMLTALRVYAWSERLALIEALLPIGLAAASRLKDARASAARLLSVGGPFFALPVLIGYFALAEYFRSWSSAFYNTKSGFWEFALGRIASYYVTSLNNGSGLLETVDWPTFDFQYTASWLYRIPFFGPTFSAYLNPGNNAKADSFDFFLTKFADPEFNNPSGIYTVIVDLGLPLGIAYFALVGMLAGVLFRSYQAGRFAGVLIYPLFFLNFLEVFRYPYLGTNRAFTWMLGIVIALLVAGRQSLNRFPVAQPV